MKSKTRVNLVIIAFINWSIALFVNKIYNYISAFILCASLAYLLIIVKELPGGRWVPINLGKYFK